ncbi:hypothetical protein GCM10007415_30070 [Parapedobacter pyrenivorans]|uniref:Uncharacterized protein n=1 Tax=Parapedobacter pyrenivorans TaxID=1305674 RepID=A0A917HW07_9SPHI|nr:hypothetical protein GCM10007415_30070 [Parapedobacter pyrenivorans]
MLREPRVALGRTPSRVPDARVPLLTFESSLPRAATVRVEMRPLASLEIAVRVALRDEEREVRVFIRSRDEERTAMRRLSIIMPPPG